jgi:hypothetical protein
MNRFNKFTVDQIEEMILQTEREIEDMKEQFGNAEIYKNPDRLADLQQSYEARQSELDLLYRAYERKAG